MNELEPDPKVFVFNLPVWFIAKSSGGKDGEEVSVTDPDIGILVAHNQRGEKCWALFTDEDLAGRWAKAIGILDPILVKVRTEGDFWHLLVEAEFLGHTRIVFDPQKESMAIESHSITEVRNSLRKNKQA